MCMCACVCCVQSPVLSTLGEKETKRIQVFIFQLLNVHHLLCLAKPFIRRHYLSTWSKRNLMFIQIHISSSYHMRGTKGVVF